MAELTIENNEWGVNTYNIDDIKCPHFDAVMIESSPAQNKVWIHVMGENKISGPMLYGWIEADSAEAIALALLASVREARNDR